MLSEEQISKIVEMGKSGYSNYLIAKKVGCNYSSVRHWLMINSCPVVVRRQKQIVKISNDDEKRMIEAYSTGKYNKIDLEKMFNVSYPVVRRVLGVADKRVPRNRKHEFNERYFLEIDTHAKAYILGFLYADGNVHSNMYTTSIGIADVDEDLIGFVQSELELNGGVYRKIGKPNRDSGRKERDSIHLNINSRLMCQDLVDQGVVPNKSLILEPPKNVPDEFLNSFVLGYFDGDGCISLGKNGSYGITIVGTEAMMRFIQNLICQGAEVNAGKISASNRINRKNPIYRTEWRGRLNCAKIGRYMYADSPFSLKRKKEKFDKIIAMGFDDLWKSRKNKNGI